MLRHGWGLLVVGLFLVLNGLPPQMSSAADPAKQKVRAADMPRIPATEPKDALSTFRLAGGFQLELVAAEPLVADPVDACFDEFGRMYVAEMHGYPFSQEPTKLNPAGKGKPDAGIIRMLQDTDGDGRMDRSVVFADKISWPTSVCCYDGGVFVLAPQFLYYFKDTDGDNKADVREVILSGFGRGNVQSLANNLKWGLDNHIYFAAGRNPTQLLHRGKPLFSARGNDLRFDPRTEKFELVTGGQQFGHSMDDWGNRFVCSNSNHIQQIVFPREYLSRNPGLAVSGLIRSIARDGASARVYRASPPEPWRIIRQKWRAAAKGYKLVLRDDGGWEFLPLDPSKKKGAVPTEYPVGYFTSATGITIYRGNAYPEKFRGNAFVGDVGGNLVHRKVLKPSGVIYTAQRADRGEEFIRTSDNWVRPVNFVNAPDGSLYVLDMYRETVEHPYSIPAEIKQFLHLESGDDRGRIYRIVSPDMRRIRPPVLGKMAIADLVKQLESTNAWKRETSQRLLCQRRDPSSIPLLESLVKSSEQPLARMHALWTLAGMSALRPAVLVRTLSADKHARVREHAIRMAEPLLKSSPELRAALLKQAQDADPRVRFQLALSLGEADPETALRGLRKLAEDGRNLGDIRVAMLSSTAGIAGRLAADIVGDAALMKQSHIPGLLAELGLLVGSDRDGGPAAQLLLAATTADRPLATQQQVLALLGRGLSRRGYSISKLLTSDKATPELRQQVARVFERAAAIAVDQKQDAGQRKQAAGVLAFADFQTASPPLSEMLTPQTPQALQRAAVAALAQQTDGDIAKLLLSGWRGYSPQVRRDVVDGLLLRVPRIQVLLEAVEKMSVARGDLERDKKQLLMNQPNGAVRDRSRKLFGDGVQTQRSRVVAEYQKVLELEGNAQRGLDVFKKKCSVCHRVGDVGHRVAPDLVSVKNKSAADLLIAILDPNREAQPNFNTYTVITENGRIYNGIIVAESAGSITLQRAEARQDVILRSTIDTLASTGISLMPEGLEKDLSPQNIADVIAFVKSIKTATPTSKPNK